MSGLMGLSLLSVSKDLDSLRNSQATNVGLYFEAAALFDYGAIKIVDVVN